MSIVINLDVLLASRKMSSKELAEAVGITPQNLSVLKAGRARAIRFSTLESICRALGCQPGDVLAYAEDGRRARPVEPGPGPGPLLSAGGSGTPGARCPR